MIPSFLINGLWRKRRVIKGLHTSGGSTWENSHCVHPMDQICFKLPPANEVWGEVMFLHFSASHSVHGGRAVSQHAIGGVHSLGRHPLGRHTPSWADTPPPGQTHPLLGRHSPETATVAGVRHPTGMHSCIIIF